MRRTSAELDTLAQELGINVALESKGDPKVVMAALEGRSKRMGVSAHLGGWMHGRHQGDRRACDRQGQAAARHGRRSQRAECARASRVALGEGAAGVGDFFLAVYKAGHQTVVDYDRVARRDGSRHGEEPAGVRARHVARDVGARERHAEDASRPDSRRRSARRRDARADRRGDPAPGAGETGASAQAARHRHSDVFGAQHDPARQLHARADGEIHRRVRTDLQQRSGAAEISEDQGVRRGVLQQRLRHGAQRSGCARRHPPLRARRGRHRRQSRRDLRESQLAGIRRHDGRLGGRSIASRSRCSRSTTRAAR